MGREKYNIKEKRESSNEWERKRKRRQNRKNVNGNIPKRGVKKSNFSPRKYSAAGHWVRRDPHVYVPGTADSLHSYPHSRGGCAWCSR